jgi:hypothetical protein
MLSKTGQSEVGPDMPTIGRARNDGFRKAIRDLGTTEMGSNPDAVFHVGPKSDSASA